MWFGPRKKPFDFGGDTDISLDVKIAEMKMYTSLLFLNISRPSPRIIWGLRLYPQGQFNLINIPKNI